MKSSLYSNSFWLTRQQWFKLLFTLFWLWWWIDPSQFYTHFVLNFNSVSPTYTSSLYNIHIVNTGSKEYFHLYITWFSSIYIYIFATWQVKMFVALYRIPRIWNNSQDDCQESYAETELWVIMHYDIWP